MLKQEIQKRRKIGCERKFGYVFCYSYLLLEVSCAFPSKVEYRTCSPKTQTVSESYSVGASVSGGSSGISAGVSGSMNLEVNALKIRSYSDNGENSFRITYDYQPGFTAYSANMVDYCATTTEQIGCAYVTSSVKNYSFTMDFTTEAGFAWGIFYSGALTYSMGMSRTIQTGF